MTASKPATAPATSAQRTIRVLLSAAVTVNFLSGIQVHHGQGTAPYAAGVQADKPFAAGFTFQRRPVAEHHGYAVLARVGKPGCETSRGVGSRLLGGQLQAAILCTKAHTRELLADHSP